MVTFTIIFLKQFAEVSIKVMSQITTGRTGWPRVRLAVSLI